MRRNDLIKRTKRGHDSNEAKWKVVRSYHQSRKWTIQACVCVLLLCLFECLLCVGANKRGWIMNKMNWIEVLRLVDDVRKKFKCWLITSQNILTQLVDCSWFSSLSMTLSEKRMNYSMWLSEKSQFGHEDITKQ